MLTTSLESILFAAAKPVSIDRLRKHFDVTPEVMQEMIRDLTERFNRETSGIHLLEHEGKVQFVTNARSAEDVRAFLKQDLNAPLSKPSVETLTVILYRGPITRPELEQIRGVNCGMILRNLLIRGMIEETQDKERLQPVYSASVELLRKLGVTHIEELPEYESFRANQAVTDAMQQATEDSVSEQSL